MKRNFTRIFLAVVPALMLWACTDFVTEDPWAPKPLPVVGPNYVPQGDHTLNVVYYIPSNMDTVAKWHYRLSGVILHARDFFRSRMYDIGIDKSLNLSMNTDSEGKETGYIRVTCVRGTVNSSDILAATTVASRDELQNQIADEVLDYIKEHPYEGGSHHYMIILPKESNGVTMVSMTNPWPNTYPFFCRAPSGIYKLDENGCYNMFGFSVCDHQFFDIRHMGSRRARTKYLSDLGPMLHELMHALGVYSHDHVSSKGDPLGLQGGRPYYSGNMGPINTDASKYVYSPPSTAQEVSYHTYVHRNLYNILSSEFKMTPLQASWLSEMQVFNKGTKDKTYYKLASAPTVTINEVNVRKQGENWTPAPVQFIPDTLLVDIKFTASAKVKFAFAYKDPWHNFTPVTVSQQTSEQADIPRNAFSDMDAVAELMELTSLGGNQYSAKAKVAVQDGCGPTRQEGCYYTQTQTNGVPSEVSGRSAAVGLEIRFKFLFEDGYSFPWIGDVKGDDLSPAPVAGQGYTTFGPSPNKMRYTIRAAHILLGNVYSGCVALMP